ncbi:glucosylglycerol-phosphate synthase [Roseibaca sp. Y0-43]|uniref:glucosylglycerol-phosphate synthase n=1 Tax=Roseibaca sp. Y0-43 TaxID=2816854 RepID=UPI001D0C6551|nr:glucosylglycerol-phosphate synthase [Roseibaca sp. Y0-43]MCC1481954.1 glucosylglycerol-phosphate synthase [Roseibaca sp. Y0-43]
MKSDLVIVYHRQPYEEVIEDGKVRYRENSSPNGIVPTMKGFLGKADRGAWVAWKEAEDPANPDFEQVIEISDSFGTYTVSRLPLTKEQVKSFYHVTSKEAFWPILHGFKERYNYDPVDWPTFRAVNWSFAEAAAKQATDDAVIWIHDYNLWLVPGYLRQLKPNATICFFHHTPFPGPDMFNVLPWREEIINSLMTCDSVGFHIPRYAQNFAAVVRSIKGARLVSEAETPSTLSATGVALNDRRMPLMLEHMGATTCVHTNPVGVNFDYIEELANKPEVAERVQEIRAELGGTKLVLSVSRTDYTKGNIEQLEAFERLLQRRKDLRGKVRLMLVSVGANRNMTAYAEVQEAIESLVGRINGTFGSFDWQPVTLVSTAIPLAQLVAYYRAADIASITPLADGLNLVASEFCAARDLTHPGALILSEFAGCAVLLDGAIPVNPFSHSSMDSGLEQALAMGIEEASARMAALRRSARTWDIAAWTHSEMAHFRTLQRERHGTGPEMAAAPAA